MRLNRDTTNATRASKLAVTVKRYELQRHIIENVLPVRASHCVRFASRQVECETCQMKKLKECTTYSNLAAVLNQLKMPGVYGKVGTWDVTRVKALFREYKGQRD